MKILIAGSDLNSRLLAQYIKLQNSGHDIYITLDDSEKNEYYTPINISESDIQSICDFVKYNQIEFTIVMSSIAIINGIADIFKNEGFPVFAPAAEASRITFFTSIAKKIMYKLRMNTPKFGIFDRENIATDYIRNSQFPVVIENDFTLFSRDSEIFNSFSKAKLKLQKIFEASNEKIVIENYIDSNPLYIYFLSDGHNSIPLITVERNEYKNFSTASAPSTKISKGMIFDIQKNAIYPLLEDINKFTGNYKGIIGLKVKIKNGRYYILEFYNNFQQYDFQLFLSLLKEDIVKLFYYASAKSINGSYNFVCLSDNYSCSVVLDKNKIINTVEDENDFMESSDENKYIITATGLTLNSAKDSLMQYLETICGETVYKEIADTEQKEEIRI